MTIPVKKNEQYTVAIENTTVEGQGVCKINGFVVFVPQTAAGDICDIRIVKVLKSHGYGIVTALRDISPDRTNADCPVYRQCGGCCFRHLHYRAELRIKEQAVRDAFIRLGGIEAPCEPILPSPSIKEYRNKAQYPVGTDTEGRMIYGFYANRSHRLIPCQDCSLQPELFSKIAADVCGLCDEYGIKAYDEEQRHGILRHIYLRMGEISGEVMLCLVAACAADPFWQIAAELAARYPALQSIVLNINARTDNVILGEKNILLFGKPAIRDELCGLVFELSPLSFYQVNRAQTERLYRLAADYAGLTGAETVIDLYCGVGTIGLSMAARAKRIIGVEVVASAVDNARENAVRNGIANAEFICADAKQATRKLNEQEIRPDVVLLDPPRKGCDTAVVQDVAAMAPQRVVMISCNPATAARDCALFEQQGYRVLNYRPVDMFPRTRHVETVVLLSKGEIDSKKVRVEFSLEDMDMSEFQDGATYPQIKAYVLEHTGLKVSNLYISQIKRKCGLEVGKNYNLPKSEDSRQPQCPPEKEKAIREAFKYFGMI